MLRFSKVAVLPLVVRYCAVNVVLPALSPVTRYMALACSSVVPARTSEVASLAATAVPPEMAKLMYASEKLPAVSMTSALLEPAAKVNVTAGPAEAGVTVAV